MSEGSMEPDPCQMYPGTIDCVTIVFWAPSWAAQLEDLSGYMEIGSPAALWHGSRDTEI